MTAVVGNFIGEGSERYGKLSALIGVIYTGLMTTLCGYLTYKYAIEIADTYTEDPDVKGLLVPLLRALSLPLCLHGFVGSL